MLDELDALMERMLALPVNDLDDLAQEPPRPTLSATLTVIDTPQAEKEEPTTSAPALPASPPTWPEQRLYQEPDASEPPASEEFPAQPDLAEHEPPASAPRVSLVRRCQRTELCRRSRCHAGDAGDAGPGGAAVTPSSALIR